MLESIDTTVDILMVDDREDGLVALEALLHSNENYKLVTARSGREALRLLPLHDFAMILLDVQMPVLDGFETAELIRRQPRLRSIPILFVTAINKDERYVYRGFELGAVDYIFKPFDPMILRSKVAVFADLHLKSRKIRHQAMALAERELLAQRTKMQGLEIESLRRYQRLADAIPHIILRMPNPDQLEYHNALWTVSTGLTAAESLGQGWQTAIDSHDLTRLLLTWQKAASERTGFEAEVRICMASGSLRWHWFKVEREEDEEVKWLATCTDIHDRKCAEVELVEARRNAETANEAKTHFLANMSHEIRTPLSAIMGFTELMLDSQISLKEKVIASEVIRRNGHQLLRIIDEILDISKVESGGLEIETIEVSLSDLMSEIKALMQAEAGKKGLAFTFEQATPLPDKIVTDPTRLRQILVNIIGNALKFTESGWVKVIARQSSMGNERALQFEVSDSGAGIDSGSSQKVFEPFSQADSSTTRLYGGTGLGLPLARRLARALGGDVRLLSSRPGQGSHFEIRIRLNYPHGESESTEEDRVSPVSPRPELFGKKVLLVEDLEDNQLLIKTILGANGVDLEVAKNGQEGLERALAGNFEAVLMDMQMPLMDGYQASARLRQAGYTRPIIALTAYALPEEREKSFKSGCTAHLTKPINRQDLIENLAGAIGQSQDYRAPSSEA